MSTEKDGDESKDSGLGLGADLGEIETGVHVMQQRSFSPSTQMTAVKAYAEKFGHLPAVEEYKFLSVGEIEEKAARAIAEGEPIQEWRERSQLSTGSSLDAWYGGTDEESE